MSLYIRDLSPEARLHVMQVIQRLLLEERLTMGQALRVLRSAHLGMTRREYARRMGISNSALSDLENDAGNPTLKNIQRAFKPFGLKVGLVPTLSSAVKVGAPEIDGEIYEALSGQIIAAVGQRAPRG